MLVITIVWWGFEPTYNSRANLECQNNCDRPKSANSWGKPNAITRYGKHTTHKIVILEMVCDWFYHFSTKFPYENCRLRA